MGSVFIATALRLSEADVEALIQGQTIAAIVKSFISIGQTFAIYGDRETTAVDFPLEKQYRFSFLSTAQKVFASPKTKNTSTSYWAKCEFCQILDGSTNLGAISKLTVWTEEALEKKLQQQEYIFLVHLRVYKHEENITVLADCKGQFIPLLRPQIISKSLAILDDKTFNHRKCQLEKIKPPTHPELEVLYSEISQLPANHLAKEQLEEDIRELLDWANISKGKNRLDPDLEWIEIIAQTGNSSNGDLFEKLVRKSLIKLGFENSHSSLQSSLDPEGCGGAGGLDFYCERPYQVVGECKATKTETVPDSTPAQLIKLGYRHLQDEYKNCVKIIMAAGKLNSHAKQTAVGNKMNVIRPETLQRLVTLKARYPGSINLIELKPCLESSPFGEEADTKLNGHIDGIKQGIKIRSHLVEAIKQLIDTEPDRSQFEVVEIRVQYNASFAKLDNGVLDNQTVYELLIELSSPLAGYLGRVRVSGLNSDRFYFLRDLPLDD